MTYNFYNRNPTKERLPDCVTRAISTALDIPYYDVSNMLLENGRYYECEELCICCYEKLLTDLRLPHYKPRRRKRVKDIARDFEDYRVIVRIEGHLTCCLYGLVYDIWDCSEEIVTDFWLVRE